MQGEAEAMTAERDGDAGIARAEPLGENASLLSEATKFGVTVWQP